MVLAGTWGARPLGKLHPPTPFCTPPLAPGQERSTSTAAPATLAACAARQGGCCERLHGVGRSVPVRGLRCSSPAPARAAGLQLGTSQPACSQGRSLLHECRTSLQRLGPPARPTAAEPPENVFIPSEAPLRAIAAASVRSGIISWAGRRRRGHGGRPGTPEHAMARARLTINAALSPQEAAGQPGVRTEASRALRLACAGLWTLRARCWSPARNMGVAANGSCGDLGGAPPRKVTPAYPILHPATCSWARAQHVHRGSSHAGSLCCEAGRLLREAARCGPVSARSGAAMQLAGPCAGSRAAAGHLPASLFTGSKPPTRVPNQSATLGPSSAPHSRRAARACLHSKRGAAQSDRSRQCAVRHHQLGRAPPARARRETRHPRTRNGARQTHHQRSPVSAGSCWPAWRAHGGNPSPQARLCRPVDAQGQVLVASTEHGGRSKWFLRGPGGRAPWESYTRLPHFAPRHLLLGKSAARPPRLQPRWQPVLRGREAAARGCTVWAGQCPFGGCDAARRPLRGQPGCSWAPPSQPAHRVEASYTSAEPVCNAWALQRAPQPQSRQSMSSFQARRRSERSQPPVCGPASSAGQGAAGAGTEGDQAPQNTQWRAPDSPSTQPCLRRKLLASLACARRHPEPSGSLVQACGRLGPGAGRQHGTWGSQQMVLAGTWGARPPGKLHPPTPFCTPPLAPGQERSTSTAAPATLAACAARQGGCCERLHGVGRSVPVRGLRCSSPAPARAAGLQLGTSQPACSQGRSLLHECRTSLQRLGPPARPTAAEPPEHVFIPSEAPLRAIAAASVRSGIISWAGRRRRGHGGTPGTPEHAMARARLTINAALSPQEAAG